VPIITVIFILPLICTSPCARLFCNHNLFLSLLLSMKLVSLTVLYSVATVVHYHASNEPVCMYIPGTDERAKLDAALKQFNTTVHDVPVIVGDEEIRSGNTLLQPKVLSLTLYKIMAKKLC